MSSIFPLLLLFPPFDVARWQAVGCNKRHYQYHVAVPHRHTQHEAVVTASRLVKRANSVSRLPCIQNRQYHYCSDFVFGNIASLEHTEGRCGNNSGCMIDVPCGNYWGGIWSGWWSAKYAASYKMQVKHLILSGAFYYFPSWRHMFQWCS